MNCRITMTSMSCSGRRPKDQARSRSLWVELQTPTSGTIYVCCCCPAQLLLNVIGKHGIAGREYSVIIFAPKSFKPYKSFCRVGYSSIILFVSAVVRVLLTAWESVGLTTTDEWYH